MLLPLVAASPAPTPQAFDISKLVAIPVTIAKGFPVGIGLASVTVFYTHAAAVVTAEAAALGAMIAPAVKNRALEPRTIFLLEFGISSSKYMTFMVF